MSFLPSIARVLLGLALLVFGLNGFLGFLPQPQPPAAGGAFLGALVGTGYLMTLVKAVEVAVGALLLANRFVPLAVIVFAPVAVNIALYHVVLDPSVPGVVVALLVFALDVYLIVAYRRYYAPLKQARAVPSAPPVAAGQVGAALS